MKARAKIPHSHRPIEYILMGIAAALAGFLVWSYFYLSDAEVESPVTAQQQDAAEDTLQPPAGTPMEVDQATEREITSEQSVIEQYDRAAATSINAYDGAADNIGGVYDETAY